MAEGNKNIVCCVSFFNMLKYYVYTALYVIKILTSFKQIHIFASSNSSKSPSQNSVYASVWSIGVVGRRVGVRV